MRQLAWLAAGVVAAGCSVTWAASPTDFAVFSYDVLNDGGVAEMPGRLYVPTGIAAGEKRPLVMFLHGVGEVGTNNSSQVNSNINGLFEEAQERGFYLYAPQLTSGDWTAARIDQALGMVAKATQEYAVDSSKMYVTGISLGGGGTKVAITNYRDTFAAAAPLSATNPSGDNPAQLVDKPIWIFHSENDANGGTPVSHSDTFYNAIRSAAGKPAVTFPAPDVVVSGAPYYPYQYFDGTTTTTVNANFYEDDAVNKNLRYSRYTSGGHATKEWTKYYREEWLYDWMYEKSNPLQQLAVDQSVNFDLGTTALTAADSQGRTWNAPLADEERTLAVAMPFARLSSGGARTSVSLSVTDKFSGTASRGLTTGTAYAAAVTQDTWTVSDADPGTILIDGLTPGESYRVAIFGSDSDSDGGRGRLTRYTIDGEYRDLEIYNNVDSVAVFDVVTADALGRFSLIVSVAPDSGARFGGIGTLEITALVPEPTALALLGAAIPLLVSRRR